MQNLTLEQTADTIGVLPQTILDRFVAFDILTPVTEEPLTFNPQHVRKVRENILAERKTAFETLRQLDAALDIQE